MQFCKNDLIDKIDIEFDLLTKKHKRGRVNKSSMAFIKSARDALYNAPMPDEAIWTLMKCENVLEDFYKDYYSWDWQADEIYKFVIQYIYFAERDYLADKLFIRAKDEYEAYIGEVKKMPPSQIITEANKITAFNQILGCLDPVTSGLSASWLKGLMAFESPLSSIYDGCKNDNGTMPDHLADTISNFAGDKASELGLTHRYLEERMEEAEEGQEI